MSAHCLYHLAVGEAPPHNGKIERESNVCTLPYITLLSGETPTHNDKIERDRAMSAHCLIPPGCWGRLLHTMIR